MAVMADTADRHAVAVPSTVHGAGWQRRLEMDVGLRAALMLNVRLVLLFAVRVVGREGLRLVDVDAEGSYSDA